MNNKTTKLVLLAISIILVLFACSNPVEQTETLNNDVEEGPMNHYTGDPHGHNPGPGLPDEMYPYPQSIIMPNRIMIRPSVTDDGTAITDAYMTDSIIEYYYKWKNDFIEYGNLKGGSTKYAYVKQNMYEEGIGVIATSSEAMGYGMIIMVIMASEDPEAHAIFDALYRTVKLCPSTRNPELMSWIGFGDDINDIDRDDSASDGDMDIAFALFMAHDQWRLGGGFMYNDEAMARINAIYDENISFKGEDSIRINLGDSTLSSESETRISDWMPSHFKLFRYRERRFGEDYSSSTADEREREWRRLMQRTDDHINEVDNSGTGLVPDFARGESNMNPLTGNWLETEYDGFYYYNACRYPLRMAAYISQFYQPMFLYADDVEDIHSSNYHDKLTTLIDWAIEKCGAENPEDFLSGYKLNGDDLPDHDENPGPDNNYDCPAFIGPITAGAVAGTIGMSLKAGGFTINTFSPNVADHQYWLANGFKYLEDNFKPYDDEPYDNGYFDSTIGLLSMFVIAGNWWAPYL